VKDLCKLTPNKSITLRFVNWVDPERQGILFFSELIEKVTGRAVYVVDHPKGKVDIEIVSVYGQQIIPSITTRAYRFFHSYLPNGIPFEGGKHTPNQQPSGNSRFSIFFTGENERPPEGTWDAYLTFDTHSYGGRNEYLPLWWITSSDLLIPTVSPYLGKEIRLDELLKPRISDYRSRKKFCVAFIGKAYPFRMHALTALSKVGRVDVYGGIARNTPRNSAIEKFKIAQDYKFVFAFENDLFPGYVTEKAPEAWATGAIPLYWGYDIKKSLNPAAMLNLMDYSNMDSYVTAVGETAKSESNWLKIANQPLLLERPSLTSVIELLKLKLSPLIARVP
jgi:hypothetical protein